jgi:hypothetical protein
MWRWMPATSAIDRVIDVLCSASDYRAEEISWDAARCPIRNRRILVDSFNVRLDPFSRF